MRINDILGRKGRSVVTMRGDATVRELLEQLATHGIGAVVILDSSDRLVGIASERDIVQHVHRSPAGALEATVSAIMTTEPITCGPDDEVEGLARPMTEQIGRASC